MRNGGFGYPTYEKPSNGAPYEKPDVHMRAKCAAQTLARLFERELGLNEGVIDSVALRLAVQLRWSQVSALAHTIHEENRT